LLKNKKFCLVFNLKSAFLSKKRALFLLAYNLKKYYKQLKNKIMIREIQIPKKNNLFFKETFDELDRFFNLYDVQNLKANFFEKNKHFNLEVLMPGFKKENIVISLEGQKLKIQAEINKQDDLEEKNYTLKEFDVNSFKKTYSLPKNSDLEKISSKYIDGILYVHIPKKEYVENKKIKIDIE
jgi:HSP20 family protein